MDRVYDVAIIGGGISGSVTALQLADNKVDTILFEQKDSVVNGPPFCHLHAGGNLYPDISDEQCKTLMKQSIEMARLFPQSIDRRPTLISIPRTQNLEPTQIERRLDILVEYYKELVKGDPLNRVLGEVTDYYKKYTVDDINRLNENPTVDNPKSLDDWMAKAIKIIDINKLKAPIFIVQEYGWNMFRLAAQAGLALERAEHCYLKTNTSVTKIENVSNKDLDHNWEVYTDNSVYKAKYLVNSGGFKTGTIEKSLNLTTQRLIEFKAAYVSKWDNSPGMLPEIIFHGERGTPNGMAQLTPYYGNYYQIHGMNKEITLFEDGLIDSKANDEERGFNKRISKKLTSGWNQDDINYRTRNAIDFVTRFVPTFKDARVGGPPLFGAQQIVGNDTSLRVAEVSFPEKFYARSEIIKASSALTVANKILTDVYGNENKALAETPFGNKLVNSVSKDDIDIVAKEIASKRGYPEDMANLLIERG